MTANYTSALDRTKLVSLLLIVFIAEPLANGLTISAKVQGTPYRVTGGTGSTKLSVDLQAARSAKAQFKGITRTGEAVFEFRDTPFSKAQAILSETEDVRALTNVEPQYDPIRELVVFAANENLVHAESVAGMPVVDRHTPGKFVVVRSNAGFSPEQLAALEADSAISYAEPNYPFYGCQAKSTPNDPEYVSGKQWGLSTINAPAAWDFVTDSRIIVAVIDSGVDYNHRDLKDNMWRNSAGAVGFDFLQHKADPIDTFGHGTQCAGVIGEVGNNGTDGVGVAWRVQLMALKVATNADFMSASAIAEAIDYAIANGARVLNNSYAGPNDSLVVHDAVRRAAKAGCLVIAAAGNNGSGAGGANIDSVPVYPAVYKDGNVIAVLATDQNDSITAWSNFGQLSVGIGAPGLGIQTVAINNKTVSKDGTSLAAPFVAGACALIWSHPFYQSYTAEQIRQVLYDNARRVPALDHKCLTGGIVDLKFLAAAAPAAANLPKPVSSVTSPASSSAQPMRITGTLYHPTFAAGGETTGTVLVTPQGRAYQLDLRGTSQLRQKAAELSNKHVVVEGSATTIKHVESGQTDVIAVSKITPQ